LPDEIAMGKHETGSHYRSNGFDRQWKKTAIYTFRNLICINSAADTGIATG